MATRIPLERTRGVARVIAYFASKRLPELTALKLNKLLYFSDKRHFLRYGRTITGDRYFGMKHGPVPSLAYDFMKGSLSDPEFDRLVARQRHLLKHDNFIAVSEPEAASFSESEVEILDEVAAELGRKTPSQLRDLAHKEPDYARVESSLEEGEGRVEIPIESFLLSLPEDAAAPARELLKEEEENERLARAL